MLERKTFWYISTTEYENIYFESKDEALDFLLYEANITFNQGNVKERQIQIEIESKLEEKYLEKIDYDYLKSIGIKLKKNSSKGGTLTWTT